MSTTTSYGYYLPETGDKGTPIFTGLEGNIQQMNDHNHNGTNSAPIPSSSLSKMTQIIPVGSWVSVGNGTYRQAITMVTQLDFDHIIPMFKDANGEQYYLKYVKIDSLNYYVYTNDNTLAVTAYYA